VAYIVTTAYNDLWSYMHRHANECGWRSKAGQCDPLYWRKFPPKNLRKWVWIGILKPVHGLLGCTTNLGCVVTWLQFKPHFCTSSDRLGRSSQKWPVMCWVGW